MAEPAREPRPGDLSWRLSSHPITLLFFLGFRIASLVIYLVGIYIWDNFVLIFIITMLLLATDFYYLKNIAGRRLVGLRWWNEVDSSAGAAAGGSHWVFESQDRSVEGAGGQNATDKRFFWLALYLQPALWLVLGILAIIRLRSPIWLVLIVIALILTITNTLAFSRCDRFGQASKLASSAMYGSGIARGLAGGVFSRLWNR